MVIGLLTGLDLLCNWTLPFLFLPPAFQPFALGSFFPSWDNILERSQNILVTFGY